MNPIRCTPSCLRRARSGTPVVRLAGVALLLIAASAAGAQTAGTPPAGGAASGGLLARDAASTWSSLQVRTLPSVQERLSSGIPQSRFAAGAGLLGSGVVADLYLSSSGLGPRVEGGFRATSGLFESPMASAMASEGGLTLRGRDGAAPLPYLGVGYGGLMVGTGLSLQADLGLVAASGAVRLGRSLQSVPPVDELIRDLRLAPVLRLGISYAF